MFRRGDSGVNSGKQRGEIMLEECDGIQPQTGEYFAVNHAIFIRRKQSILPVSINKPVHHAVFSARDQIFLNSISAIDILFHVHVNAYCGSGHLAHQCRRPGNIIVFINRAFSLGVFGKQQKHIRLGFIVLVETNSHIVAVIIQSWRLTRIPTNP